MKIKQAPPYFLIGIILVILLIPAYSNAVTQTGNISYKYDGALGRVASVISSTIGSFNMTYDAAGKRTSLTYPNGTTTTYSYDCAGNLLEIAHKTTQGIIEKLTYRYNPNSHRISAGRLNYPAAKHPQKAANIKYDAANRMIEFNEKKISYDNNGNMTSVTDACGITSYIWDARNRLVGIKGFNKDCSTLNASFKYDALNRRIEKTINGKTINYLYDGWDIIQEIEDGIVSANYIRNLNFDEPFARLKSDGTIRYYHADALGSIIALTDEKSIVKTRYIYGPFGETEVIGEQSDNPFQFAGRENDSTGLLYERNRYYSLEFQRYISEDPIMFAGGDINLYLRAGNNPVNYTDPLGLQHLGFIKQLWKYTNPQLLKAIKSLTKNISEHEKALLDPKQVQVINKHQHELRVFREQLRLAEEEARKRGLKGVAGFGGVGLAGSGKCENISQEEAEKRTDSWFDWLDPFLSPGYAY